MGDGGHDNVSVDFVLQAGMRGGHPAVIEGENEFHDLTYSCVF